MTTPVDTEEDAPPQRNETLDIAVVVRAALRAGGGKMDQPDEQCEAIILGTPV